MTRKSLLNSEVPLVSQSAVFIAVITSPVWIVPFLGHCMLSRGSRRKKLEAAEEVTVWSAHPFFHFSYFIAAGLMLPLFGAASDADPEILTWCWISTLVVSLLVVMFDLNFKGVFITACIISLVVALCVLVKVYGDFPVIGILGRAINGLDATVSSGAMILISILLLFLQALTWVGAAVDGRWNFLPGRVVRAKFGSSTNSYERDNLRINFEYEDWMQKVLFKTGHIVFTSTTNQQEVVRIPNVMGLPRLERKLGELFSKANVKDSQEAA